MIRRYELQFTRRERYTGAYVTHCIKAFKTLQSAIRAGENYHHKKLQFTYGSGQKVWVDIVDVKTGKSLWSHPGFHVPSVGELGYW